MGETDKTAARLLENEREARRSKRAIGERLELARHLLGKSQKAFATDAGIARNTYNQYETGTNTPSLPRLNHKREIARHGPQKWQLNRCCHAC